MYYRHNVLLLNWFIIIGVSADLALESKSLNLSTCQETNSSVFISRLKLTELTPCKGKSEANKIAEAGLYS